MLKQSFLGYQELKDQLEDFEEYGWSRTTMDHFVKTRLILGCPDKESGGFRYYSEDVEHLLKQRRKNAELEANK